MNWKRVGALLLIATAIQFLLGGSRLRSIWPIDVFLIATAIVARGGNSVTAVLVGGTMGLLEDALTSDLLGMNAFAKAAIGYVLALLSIRVMFGGIWAVGAALAAASLANDAIVAVLASLLLQAPIVLLSRESLWRAAATGATAALLEAARRFAWRDWWEKRRLRRLR
ncbi:MAG TPA: rod shape-determining protein MreD [Thermoanaerobaculia bacterium]|nr:rod shape-determining protein MreD [Thermoanaerobaculia bacterium]